MKLSDIVGHWDLAMYPKVALIIFLAVFVCVVVRLYLVPGGRRYQRFASMALEDDVRTGPAARSND